MLAGHAPRLFRGACPFSWPFAKKTLDTFFIYDAPNTHSEILKALPKPPKLDTVAISHSKIAHPASTGNSSKVGRCMSKKSKRVKQSGRTIHSSPMKQRQSAVASVAPSQLHEA